MRFYKNTQTPSSSPGNKSAIYDHTVIHPDWQPSLFNARDFQDLIILEFSTSISTTFCASRSQCSEEPYSWRVPSLSQVIGYGTAQWNLSLLMTSTIFGFSCNAFLLPRSFFCPTHIDVRVLQSPKTTFLRKFLSNPRTQINKKNCTRLNRNYLLQQCVYDYHSYYVFSFVTSLLIQLYKYTKNNIFKKFHFCYIFLFQYAY